MARCSLAVLGSTALLAALAGPCAAADPPVPLRAAVHDGFTRLVFDFPAPTTLDFHRDASTVELTFSSHARFAPPSGFATPLHNLTAAFLGDGSVTLGLAPGVTVHSMRLGNRRVIDLIDPGIGTDPGIAQDRADRVAARPPAAPPIVKAAPKTARLTAARPLPIPSASVAASITAPDLAAGLAPTVVTANPPAPEDDAGSPLPDLPVARADGPAPEHALRAPLAIDPSGPLVLPFAAATGAAAFRRGDSAVVVFDEPRAIDPASLAAHAGLAGATVQLLPQGVVLRFPLPPDKALALTHDGTDWSIATVPATAPHPSDPMPVAAGAGSLHLAATGAGHVIVVPDPMTGDTLLVGTAVTTTPYVGTSRHNAEFVLLPSFLGVALEPLSEHAALHAVNDGFVVSSDTPNTPLAISAAPPDAALALAAARLSRSFDFPAEPAPALLRRLHAQISDAASAPLLSRLPYRRNVAQTMAALGMGAEAQAVLLVAAADDPRALTDPPTQALAAAAALLAGRLDETGGLDATTGAPETDEHRLWRALRDADRLADGTAPPPDVTRAIAAGLPLLLSYPATLQRTLLPLAADTLLRGNDLATVDRLLAASSTDPGLALARSAAAEQHGQTDTALAGYDRLTVGRDRSMRARAAISALQLRLAHHLITPAQAAAAGDKLIYSWRGDARERDTRLRVAGWQGEAGQFRQQLESLREALDAFPDPTPDPANPTALPPDSIRPRLQAAFAGMVRDEASDKLTPLDLVALVQENTDLLPDGPAGEAMVGKLADRLAALDLPQQAAEVLRRLVHDTPSAAAKGVFGARLASLLLAENQTQPALDALNQSDSATLSPQLTEQRALLASRAHAALGDRTAALATLAPLAGADALLARAQVLENAHDWPATETALGAYAAQTLPATGPLDPGQSGLVLRLASATAQAGDEASLAKLQTQFGGRLPDANDAALLGVLTESPVKGVADLPRAARETAAARAVPVELQAMAHAQ